MKNKNLIYGRHPVLDAINSGKTIEKVFLMQGTTGPLEKELRKLSQMHGFPMSMVPKEKLQRMVPQNHQGVAAQIGLIEYKRIEDVLPFVFEKGEMPLFLILDGVTDVRNLGAIARSALLCGVHAIIVPSKGTALVNADAVKSSAGAIQNIDICRVKSLVTTIRYLRDSGVQVFASNIPSEKGLHELDLTGPTAIVMGDEGEGVGNGILKEVEQEFWIPQIGDTNSFNVSVASGIVLYESMRQRHLKS
ncbi:MAG: 23S rRNA (guanosine(2251)-2'-O)-methyltransferase RlmB [Saprospiraceae bacterium]|nr:23S rRNA (guanosine(2251)-2'-O)-methyltransferase RlmB [Saprospiraceae bacterium]